MAETNDQPQNAGGLSEVQQNQGAVSVEADATSEFGRLLQKAFRPKTDKAKEAEKPGAGAFKVLNSKDIPRKALTDTVAQVVEPKRAQPGTRSLGPRIAHRTRSGGRRA